MIYRTFVDIRVTSQGPGLYVADTIDGNTPAGIVACSMQDQDTKIFAVNMSNDLTNDIRIDGLQSNLMDVYVGGEVQHCDVLELMSRDADTAILV